jgi:hypothetical protein
MANDELEDVALLGDEIEAEDLGDGGEEDKEPASKTQDKPVKRTPEEQLKYLEGRAARLRKTLGLTAPRSKDAPETTVESKTNGPDYGELALKSYLKSEGVSREDFDFVRELMSNTGKAPDELLATKWVQAELKERVDTRMAQDAIPKGSKRSAQNTRDSVEYWIAKGELPPVDQVDLRRKVVNAKLKSNKDKNRFTDNPVM